MVTDRALGGECQSIESAGVVVVPVFDRMTNGLAIESGQFRCADKSGILISERLGEIRDGGELSNVVEE